MRLGTPVRAIEDGVVRTDGGDLDAAHVIVAVPLPRRPRAPFAAALPDWKRAALGRVEMGHAAKLHVAAGGAPPTRAR